MAERRRRWLASGTIGLTAAGMGLALLWIGQCAANQGAGELGVGIWSVGSAGMGVTAGSLRGGSSRAVVYLQLALFGLLAAGIAWLFSSHVEFIPLVLLNTFLLLAGPILGFWLGFFVGAGSSHYSHNGPGGIPESPGVTAGSNKAWILLLLLQICVVSGPVLGILSLTLFRNSHLWIAPRGFWFELSAILWLPAAMAICAVLPWSSVLGLPPLHRALLVRVTCVLSWLFIGCFMLFLLFAHRT